MKRKVLALMVPALLMASAANAAEIYNKNGNKLDLYGKVDGLHYFSDDASEDGDQTYVRFGLKGETQITSELTGYGQWEYNIQANTSEKEGANSWTRLGFAGLKFADCGSLDYGRNYGVATYRNSDFFGLVDGLHFALQYQGNNENAGSGEGTNNGGKRKLARENGDGFGISSYYDLDMGISFGAAYSSSDRTHNQLAAARSSQRYANGDKADAWTVGAKYDANNIYLAAMYAETRNMTFYGNDSFGGIANKTQNFEVVAQYQFDDFNLPLRPSVAYLQSKGKDLYAYSRYGDKDLVKYVDVGMTYYFNKNMSTYVDYKINLLDEDDRFYKNSGIATDDIVALGLVYQF
ncbi:TPA: porin [Klebsiella pneumoniae]